MLNFVKALSTNQKRAIFLATDLALVPVAFVLALLLQVDGDTVAHFTSAMPVFGVIMVLAAALSSLLGLPDTKLNAYDLGGISKTAVFALGVTLRAFVVGSLGRSDLTVGLYIVFGLVYFLVSALVRLGMLHLLLHLYRNDESRCRVLIYGAGTTGLQLVQALKAHELIVPVAFADDNSVIQGRYIGGLPVLRPNEIIDFAKSGRIDRILLAMPSLSPPKRTQIARKFEEAGLEVQALPSFAQLIGQEALVDKFAPVLPGQILGRDQVNDTLTPDEIQFARKSILVSGAGGSIGSELCRQVLASKPKKVVLFELSELALYTIEIELRDLTRGAEIEILPVLGSIEDERLVQKTLDDHDVDVVLHAAAYKHVPLVESNVLTGLSNNVLGTSVLARASRDANVERFILISSDKAVRPTNVMGASKRLAELIVQDLAERSTGTVFAMVRFGNVLGSSGSVVPLFQDQIARGGPVTLTHPDVQRYFMTVEEAVRLVLRASTFAKGGEVFVLDMGQPVRIAHIARQMIEMAGFSVCDEENPDGDISIEVTGLRPGEKLNEELLIGEGHLTTSHEKIFAAREACLSEIEVAAAMRALRDAIALSDDQAALDVLARWVEGWADARPDLGGRNCQIVKE